MLTSYVYDTRRIRRHSSKYHLVSQHPIHDSNKLHLCKKIHNDQETSMSKNGRDLHVKYFSLTY